MADARKCDICGGLFESRTGIDKPDAMIIFNRNYDYFMSRPPAKDCCPSCMSAIQKLMNILSLDDDIGKSDIVESINEYCSKIEEV